MENCLDTWRRFCDLLSHGISLEILYNRLPMEKVSKGNKVIIDEYYDFILKGQDMGQRLKTLFQFACIDSGRQVKDLNSLKVMFVMLRRQKLDNIKKERKVRNSITQSIRDRLSEIEQRIEEGYTISVIWEESFSHINKKVFYQLLKLVRNESKRSD